MALADLRLALMTFAQRWDGTSLSATVLVLPSGDPTLPLLPGTPAFAGTEIRLRAGIIPSLDALPALGTGTIVGLLFDAPVHAPELFADLKTKFAPQDTVATPPPPVAAFDRIRKALPDSYTALLAPGAQHDPNVASADDFGCTLRGQRPPAPKTTPRTTSWGELISHALRNPYLADALGLRYEFTFNGDDAKQFVDGGWLYVTLDPVDPYFAAWDGGLPDAVKSYAARIPALAPATPRQLFTAVLFPVANPKGTVSTPNEAEIDRAIVEAEIYDDGFAEMMHARQPDSLDAHVGDGKVLTNAATDAGIQIGWDDEQVLRWHNRQIAISAAQQTNVQAALEAPLGVLGYRVDVRVPAPGEAPADKNTGWQSLMTATGTVPDALKDKIKAFTGELTIEPTPTSPANARDFWLPLYFAQWRGTPLGTRDDTPHLLAGGTAAKDPAAITLKESRFVSVTPSLSRGPRPPTLLYGTTYEFRTRLSDLTGGGPKTTDTPIHEAIAERTSVTFQRWVPPKSARIDMVSDAPHAAPYIDHLNITRPLIGYPEALFTQRYGTDPKIAEATKNALLAQLGMTPDGTPPPAPPAKNTITTIGVPDPDIVSLEIVVEARALAHDRADDLSADGSFVKVYLTTRDVPPLAPIAVDPDQPVDPKAVVQDDPFTLDLQYVDVDDIATLIAPAVGPLSIPRSRDVRIRITPLAANPAGIAEYFGTFPDAAARVSITRGNTSSLLVHAPALAEATPLFAPLLDARPNVQALFFQPHTDGDPVAGLMRDLASQLELDVDGMTLRGRPGERVAFGATGFKNTIASDGGSITFASATEIFRHWTVAVQWELARDWTWDGLTGGAVNVGLVHAGPPAAETLIGQIVVPRIASAQAIEATPDRKRTRLVFFQAIDPAIADPRDGFTNRDAYRLSAWVPADAPAPLQRTSDAIALRLPVATIPAGIPKLASAGYALSAYAPAADYSSTPARHRQLWLEITEPPAKGDRLFARVLAYAPDPLLYADPMLRAQQPGEDPPLKLDPELVRVITSGQPRDEDGLEAMVELHASPDDPLKFLLPLPDGVAEADARLFGMWTYELRYGHEEPWSLAHARFGRPLRVTGVQHPAPELPAVAAWQRVVTHPAVPQPNGHVITLTRTTWQVVATAPYATPVLADGRRVGTGLPLTTIGFLLYAQAIQADGSGYRNVLLAHQGAVPVQPRDTPGGFVYDYGSAVFTQSNIEQYLAAAALPGDAPLSIVAVEFYAPGGVVATLGNDFAARGAAVNVFAASQGFDPFDPPNFGRRRIVRTSPLVKVEPYC
jgi:hypothetical protein